MRWIEFENKTPVQPLKDWEGWTAEKWQKWLDESRDLHASLAAIQDEIDAFHASGNDKAAEGKLAERNKFIDDHSDHWGKLKPWLFALSHGKC